MSVLRFVLLTYALSWSVWLVAATVGGHPALVWFGAWGPTAAALAVTSSQGGRRAVASLIAQLRPQRMRPGTVIAALVVPFPVAAAGVAAHAVWTGTAVEARSALALYLLPVHLVVGVLIGPLQEELGWRGVALSNLLARRSRLTASLVVGVAWAVWHVPLFAVERRDIPLAAFMVGVAASSLAYTELYRRTGPSLAVVIAFHAASNTAVQALLQRPAAEGESGPFMAATAVMVLIAVGIAVWWRRQSTSSQFDVRSEILATGTPSRIAGGDP